MAVERFVIEQLTGVNRNWVDGIGEAPDELRNLTFDRSGGWRYYGESDLAQSVATSELVVSAVSGNFGFYRVEVGNDVFLHRSNPNQLWVGSFSALTKWNSIPTARYGPWYVVENEVTSFPSVGMENEYIASGTTHDLPLGDYTFAAAEYVETDQGKFIFAWQNAGGTVSADVTISSAGQSITVINYSGNPRLVYLREFEPNDPDDADEVRAPSFVVDLEPGGLYEISNPTQFIANSDVWVRSHHDLTEFHQGRMYVANPIALVTELSAFEPFNGPGWLGPGSGIPELSIVSDAKPYGNLVFFIFLIPTVNPDAPGGINIIRTLNYFSVPVLSRGQILALKSTPAGLLIFSDNEMFLFRGDPAAGGELKRFSSSVGLDVGTEPVSMAGIVFSIYAGEVYMISLGMGDVDFGSGISKISGSVYDFLDPFVELSADRERNQLIAKTESNRVFNYVVSRAEWFENPYSRRNSLQNVLDYGGGPDIDGALFLVHPPGGGTSIEFVQYDGAHHFGDTPPSFKFENLDFGDKRIHKLFRSIEVYTNTEYNGTPTMNYEVANGSGTIVGEEFTEGRWVFRLPAGTSGPYGSFEFTFPDMGVNDVIEPPIVFNFVPQGRRRI